MRADKKICSKCLMDTTVPGIGFDTEGVCNFCSLHYELERKFPLGKKGEEGVQNILHEIRSKKGSDYDCVVGISGGVDSSYLLYMVKKWGLRPLAVHLNNGWNTKTAEHNMNRIVQKLGVDIRVENVNWEEFRNLQIAFLRASVPDIEIPTDVGIYATLYKVAAKEDIPSVINGHSFRTEGTQPVFWTYMDGRYIESVFNNLFPDKKLTYFSNLKINHLIYYLFVKRIKEYRPLEYLDYDKKKAARILNKEFGWQDYGGHHHESVYTRFVATYILPTKFNIDKRKVSLSAQIRSKKMLREDALLILKREPYPPDKVAEDKRRVLEKLGISESLFKEIMNYPVKSHLDYATYHSAIKRFRFFVKMASELNIVPKILYEKYAK